MSFLTSLNHFLRYGETECDQGIVGHFIQDGMAAGAGYYDFCCCEIGRMVRKKHKGLKAFQVRAIHQKQMETV